MHGLSAFTKFSAVPNLIKGWCIYSFNFTESMQSALWNFQYSKKVCQSSLAPIGSQRKITWLQGILFQKIVKLGTNYGIGAQALGPANCLQVSWR
jgi:hypothetical protein